MNQEQIQKLQVFHLFCHYALPNPKPKYVVIVCVEPFLLGFMINSKINAYVATRPKLLACYSLLKVNQHAFLQHDSYVDCSTPCPFSASELVNPQGFISEDAKPDILKAVKACTELDKRYKKMILSH